MNQTLAAPVEAAPNRESGARALRFEELYRSSRDDVFAYVAGLLRDRSAAEDVTAAAFERAFRKRAKFDPKRGEPRAWIFGIARNAALDELRRRGRQAEMTTEPPDEMQPSPEDLADRGIRRSIVSAAFEKLTPGERELISLKFFAGLSNAEIAQVIGASETNAGTKLHRTVTKLRRACNETA